MCLVAAVVAAPVSAIKAQNGDVDKQIEKAQKLVEKNKAEDAEKVLKSLAEKYPKDGKVWDELIKTQLAVYADKKKYDNMFGNMTVTSTDSKGNKIENDSLTEMLKVMLASTHPSEIYMNHIINTCRVGCCETRMATNASVIIRVYRVDKETDSIKQEARHQFALAESEFGKKNYSAAANYYQKAIDIDTTFYKARLYLGDVYFFTKRYDLAIAEFKKAVATRPDLLEPRKYLIDALKDSEQYEGAYAAAVDALSVYPDFVLFYNLEGSAKRAGIKCNLHWISRDVLPNSVKKEQTDKDDITLPAPKNSPWIYYKEALEKVRSYCNNKGIISENPVTNRRYLEVYSWEQMLAKTKDPEFDFARKMKEKGFLDCYVFISCFHYDIYDQYKDFVAANRTKVKDYLQMLKNEGD
jgi:tetratricopeptide (TPR) repeat protein